MILFYYDLSFSSPLPCECLHPLPIACTPLPINTPYHFGPSPQPILVITMTTTSTARHHPGEDGDSVRHPGHAGHRQEPD